MKLKFLQWNVLYKEKIENIFRTAEKINPDVICLQEMTVSSEFNTNKNTPEWLSRKLGYNFVFSAADKFSDTGMIGNAILTRYRIKDRLSRNIQFPSGDEEDYSAEGRSYAEIAVKMQGKIFRFGTVHMSFVPKFLVTPRKRTEFRNLLALLNKKERFIFSGDFNATPGSSIVRTLKKHFVHCGPGMDEPTWTTKPFNYKGFKENKLRWRLDYVFATPDIRILSAEIVKTKYSDHLPILVEFEL